MSCGGAYCQLFAGYGVFVLKKAVAVFDKESHGAILRARQSGFAGCGKSLDRPCNDGRNGIYYDAAGDAACSLTSLRNESRFAAGMK